MSKTYKTIMLVIGACYLCMLKQGVESSQLVCSLLCYLRKQTSFLGRSVGTVPCYIALHSLVIMMQPQLASSSFSLANTEIPGVHHHSWQEGSLCTTNVLKSPAVWLECRPTSLVTVCPNLYLAPEIFVQIVILCRKSCHLKITENRVIKPNKQAVSGDGYHVMCCDVDIT